MADYEPTAAVMALRNALPGIHAWFGDEDLESAAQAMAQVLFADLREEVTSMRDEAWIDYRTAVPGDTDTVSDAAAVVEACRRFLDMIDERASNG